MFAAEHMNYLALKDVCCINMGQSPDSKSYNDSKEGIPFFQGNADFGEKYPITRVWCNAPTKIAKKDDILISVRAPIGALNYAKETCCIGRGLAAITPNKAKVSTEFIFWLLKGKNNELNRLGTGSTFKAISKKVLEETKIPDISLEKQIACSNTLEKLYSIITHIRTQLEKLDLLVKARFVEMFGDVIHNSKGFETQKGNKLFKISNGKAVPNNKRFFEGIPAYGGNGISWYTDEALFNDDTIVIGRVGFQSGNVHLASGPLWITDNAMYVSELYSNSLDLIFLCELMEQIDFTKHQDAGDLKKVTQKSFMEMEYIIPPIEIQKEYTSFVSQVDKSKVAMQKELGKAQTLFDSLMQEYFG